MPMLKNMDSSVDKKNVEARKKSLRRKLMMPSQAPKASISIKHVTFVTSNTFPFIVNRGICIVRIIMLAKAANHNSFRLKTLLLNKPRINSQKK